VSLLAVALALAVAAEPAQRDMTFASRDGSAIAATIAWPANVKPGQRVPGILLLGGSGLHDRNEQVGPNKPFEELSQTLVDDGYAVLRYDKRGAGASHSAVPLLTVTRQSFLDDAQAALKALSDDPHVDASHLYLVGHSEGGELAMGLVLAGAPVRGIVLLSPLPMPYAQILQEQVARQHYTAAQRAAVDKMVKLNHVFLDSYANVDPREEIARLGVPMLLLHGSKDMQVTTADLVPLVAAAKAAGRNLVSVELENDNHLFATLPGDVSSTGAEYFEARPLDARLGAEIAKWLRDLGS
jgi:pimeloyl-ACP methyl ester carboxylesterase